MFAIRGLQALFAVIVFGLATSLIKGHHLGSLPSTLGFVAFVGGVSFVAALLGIAARWILVLQGKAGVLIDAVIACFNVAGGVVSVVLDCWGSYLMMIAHGDQTQRRKVQGRRIS